MVFRVRTDDRLPNEITRSNHICMHLWISHDRDISSSVSKKIVPLRMHTFRKTEENKVYITKILRGHMHTGQCGRSTYFDSCLVT